jgi:hypothetical protein
MAITDRTIEVEPGGELDRLLDEANGARLILVKDGVRYRLAREDAEPDIWANYDPERVRQVLRETAGAWKDIDTEALKADIKAQRGQDSHGRPGDA